MGISAWKTRRIFHIFTIRFTPFTIHLNIKIALYSNCEVIICAQIVSQLVMSYNFDQTVIFLCSLFGHFVQRANKIWYLRRLILALHGYQISLTSCMKWWNSKWLKTSSWSKLFCNMIIIMKCQKWIYEWMNGKKIIWIRNGLKDRYIAFKKGIGLWIEIAIPVSYSILG